MQIDAALIFEDNEADEILLRVQGTSMQPFLYDKRDSVLLRKEKDYKKGDIVVFRYHKNYVIHRIISIDGDYFTALGDNLGYPEKDVPINNIVYKAVSATRNGRKLSPKSPLWLFFSHIYINITLRKLFRKLYRLIEKIKSGREKI